MAEKSVLDMTKTLDRSVAGSFAALAAIALAIIGLAGVYPLVLLPVATIALGAALLFHAGVLASRFSALVAETSDPRSPVSGRWGGMTIGFIAGVGGIALGILALLGISPMTLTPIAAILYGTALIMDSGIYGRLNALDAERYASEGLTREVLRENAAVASGIQVLVGLGSITLGILALMGINSGILGLVAMMSVSAALILSSFLSSGRMVSVFRG